MSGGSFDYTFHGTSDFADALSNRLEGLDKREVGSCNWPEDVIGVLQSIARRAKELSNEMREVEWLYSGDIGPETFLKRIRDLKRTVRAERRKTRIIF